MKGKGQTALWAALTLTFLFLNLFLWLAPQQEVEGHDWWLWRQWNRSVQTWIHSGFQAEARAARDDWHNNTILSLPLRNSHTEISVYGGNWGDTGWRGLASVESVGFGWWTCWTWCIINHGHARYNDFFGGSTGTSASSAARGTMCQEVGHLFGLTHSAGDCMGRGYFSSWSNVVGPHSVSDINNKY